MGADNWRMLLEFFLDIKRGFNGNGYSNYVFDISYPVLFEDFQDYLVELKLAEA